VVDIRQTLAAADPDAFRVPLVTALENLDKRLCDVGHLDEAIRVAEQVVEVRRELVTADPEEYGAAFATALDRLADRFRNAGRASEALRVDERAVDAWREMATLDPEAYGAQSAFALHTLATALQNAERYARALHIAKEAVSVLQPHFLAHTISLWEPMEAMVQTYTDLVRLAGATPDSMLLEPITARLDSLGRHDPSPPLRTVEVRPSDGSR
jgi:tetratricopeptide (TPR) repeat protein